MAVVVTAPKEEEVEAVAQMVVAGAVGVIVMVLAAVVAVAVVDSRFASVATNPPR